MFSRNKYNAVRTEYNGKVYDSKREAEYAQELDLLKRAGEIKDWIPQYKIDLEVYGQKLWTYKVDFKIINNDGSIELHEVKGKENRDWKHTWKLLGVIYNKKYPKITLKVIK